MYPLVIYLCGAIGLAWAYKCAQDVLKIEVVKGHNENEQDEQAGRIHVREVKRDAREHWAKDSEGSQCLPECRVQGDRDIRRDFLRNPLLRRRLLRVGFGTHFLRHNLLHHRIGHFYDLRLHRHADCRPRQLQNSLQGYVLGP